MIEIKKISRSGDVQDYIVRKAKESGELHICDKGKQHVSVSFSKIVNTTELIEIDKKERPYYWSINPITMLSESSSKSTPKPVMSEVVINTRR